MEQGLNGGGPRHRTWRVVTIVAAVAMLASVGTVVGVRKLGASAPPIGPVSASQKAIRVTPAPPAGRFGTLPPGSPLPSDAECAGKVRSAAEVRADNTTYNHTTGQVTVPQAGYPLQARVTGNFTGSTDEIIQWAACKWGIDEDIVRAQAAKESWWHQSTVGDFTSDPSICAPGHPVGADGHPGQCPESVGLLQIRYQYSKHTFPSAGTSTAYNADYAYAIWRTCFEGGETWLNTVDRGQQYAAGDQWGCVGRWFAGRWHTAAADQYMTGVQQWYTGRIWETSDFKNG